MSNLETNIRSFMDTIVVPGLTKIIGADYQTKLGQVFSSQPSPSSSTKPSTTPPTTPSKAAVTQSKPAVKKAAKKKPGEKRTPEELSKVVENLHDYIVKHPGSRMEAIAKGMGKTTAELNLPIKKLIAAKRLKVVGEKRATEYTAS
jgi:hypothetical protein